MAARGKTQISHPAARSERVLIENIGLETVIFDLDTRASHALKPLAAAVFMYADGRNTAAEIAELASYRLATTVTEAEVDEAAGQLAALNLLDGHDVLVEPGGISRRDALKTFAVAGAGAALVTTVAAPMAMAATSPAQTQLGDYQLCVTGTATNVTYTEGSNSVPNGVMIPGVGGAQINSYDQGYVKWANDIWPAPGVYTITVGGQSYQVSHDVGWNGYTPTVTYGDCCYYLAWDSKTKCYSEEMGGWQCVPCDGVDSLQCCSVVCAPVGAGYDWGASATAPSGYPYPYTGCGTQSTSGGCPNPGQPDYTSLGYHGKYCTHGGGKPKS